jgi:cytochrome c553
MKTLNTATKGIILPGSLAHTLARTLLALLLASLPVSLLAEGSPAAGKEKAKVCEACHGLDGKSIAPNYPNLAGQHEDYLVKALADYRAGRRTNPLMAPMAANLSDRDIEDLAAWYASQEGLKDLSIR